MELPALGARPAARRDGSAGCKEGLPEAKGQTYRLPAGSFFEIRDGQIARITTYYNLTDWSAQVVG